MSTARPLAVSGALVLTPAWDAERLTILIEGDEIAGLLPADAPLPPDVRIIEATDRAVMPGLVNAHVHGHGTLAKGLVEDRWPVELFLNALPGLGANRLHADMHLNGLLGAVEMIRKGCTACFDLFFEFPQPTASGLFAVAQAYSDAGVRAVVAPMVADRTFYQAYPELLEMMPAPARAEAEAIRLAPAEASSESMATAFRTWPYDRARVRPGIAPAIPLHCSDGFLQQCDALVREFDLVLQTHLAESRIQAITGLRRYGRTLTAHLDALGLLGPHFSGAHAIWLDDDDMRRLADRGATAVHAPSSNLRFGSGLAPVRRMLDHGVAVGLATDATNSSDALNMYEAMRVGAGISRVGDSNFDRWLSAMDMLAMATTGSARALGWGERIGRIAPGCKADLVFLDLGHINYVPLGNLARQIVFTENAAAVDSVMVGGRLVLDRGRITTLDEAKLRRDATEAAARLYAANAPLRERSHRLQPAVAAFCRSFGCTPYHVHRLACMSGTAA
jgi:5-methylthioadenosine/S-adenosylhomocysteine deaminase